MSNLPSPVLWRVLVRLTEMPDKIGSLYVPQNAKDNERHLACMGEVVEMGPLCFTREDMRDLAAYKRGDTIMFSKYAGARFLVDGKEYRILNDDEALAVVPDPGAIKRAA